MPSLKKHRHDKKKKAMCAIWDEINKSVKEDDYNAERQSLSCFMIISTKVTLLNSKFDNSINEDDIPSYDVVTCVQWAL